jgi:FMN reductase [NAD(P)H]
MEFQELLRRRRMIRRYRPDPLPQDAVERIIAAALHGPSAGFSQGIDVTAVLQPEMRRRVVV